MPPSKITSRIVLAGGGHSHVQFLKSWRMQADPQIEVVLISTTVATPYSGMLPSRLAGWYSNEEMHFYLAALCAQSGVTFIEGEVTGVDTKQRLVHLRDYPSLYFDVLSIDIGITPEWPIGAEENPNVMAVKPIATLLPKWEKLWKKGDSRSSDTWAIVGAGAAGFELAMICQQWAKNQSLERKFILVEGATDILPSHSVAVRRHARRLLQSAGIEVRTGFRVSAIDGQNLIAASGQRMAFDRALLTTGAAVAPWLKASGLPVDDKGFVKVQSTLAVEGFENIFAVGDCTHFAERALPKSGVYAVRQGPILSQNLRRAVHREPLRRYRPQRRTLSLLTSGHKRALASYGPFHIEGEWAWRWKDRIDRRFMKRFGHHKPRAMEGDANRCGGCGGKMAPATVHALLDRLQITTGAEDVGWIGDTASTIDGFRSFTDDLYFYGLIGAWHALNDLYASGAKPTGANVYVGLPESSNEIRLNRLEWIMRGVLSAFQQASIPLLNAHSAEASEPTLVISALGTSGVKWRKAGLKPGDILIMTKPIGTGGLLQAAMAGALASEVGDHLREVMLRHHAPLTGVLEGYSVSASTDVTGFGLLGHLTEMALASRVAIEIYPAETPILDGFQKYDDMGFRSYITGENARAFAAHVEGSCEPWMWHALWDPQTHGPLILALPIKRAEALLKHLKALGFPDATVIGRVAGEIGAKPSVRLMSRQ